MKKQIFKIGKKVLNIALTMFVVAGAVCYAPEVSVDAAEYAYESDTLLGEYTYDEAVHQVESRSEMFYNTSGDLSPHAAPDDAENTVLWYQQYWYGLGLAILGHDYKSGTIENRIEVEPGVAYKVEFDLYNTGEVNLSSDLEIGLGIGADSFGGNINETNVWGYLDPHEKITSFRAFSTHEEGWNTYTGYITVPEDADVTTNNALILYFKGAGNTSSSYIDNVKVTALAGVTVNYVIGDDTKTVYYADGIIPTELPEGIAAEDEEGNALKLYSDSKYKTTFSAEGYERTGKQAEVTLYGTYKEPSSKGLSSASGALTNPVTYVVLGVVVVAVVAVVVIIVAKAKKKK